MTSSADASGTVLTEPDMTVAWTLAGKILQTRKIYLAMTGLYRTSPV
jgi:heptaprenylglyceryl phosphate synthase